MSLVVRWSPTKSLILLGLLSALGYLLASRLRGWSTVGDVGGMLALFAGLFVLYGLAFVFVRQLAENQRVENSVGWILFAALVFRLLLIPAGIPGGDVAADLRNDICGQGGYDTYLLYDNDVWRYLWDGHVLASGVNTYAYSPAEIAERAEQEEAPFAGLLAEDRWQEVHDNVAFQEYRTVYPPAAQALFVLSSWLAPASVAVFKLVLILFDLATCWLLADLLRRLGRSPSQVLLYAWNPLAIKEIAGSAHVDGLLAFSLVLALWLWHRQRAAGALVALAAAVLTKLVPLLLVPLFLRRIRWQLWWLLPLTGGLAFLPFWRSLPTIADSVGAFAGEWVFNPGPWLWLERLTQLLGAEGRGAADVLARLLVMAAIGWICWMDRGDFESLIAGCHGILAVYLILSPTVMPWYLVWLLPLLALRPRLPWLALSGLSMLSYLFYIDGSEHGWWLALEFGAFAILWLVDTLRRARSF